MGYKEKEAWEREQRRGVKHDRDKRRWDLLPWNAAGLVVDVLAHGARKYSDDNWRRVPDARRRYFAAALRHIVAWYAGEYLDDESRLPHLAHAACCVLFLLALEESDIVIDTAEDPAT